MIGAIYCPDLSENKFVSIYTNFKDSTYRLTFKWNEYCNCCLFSIYDSNGELVNGGNALTTKSIIHTDRRKVPTFYFRHEEDLSIEPTPETLKEYILAYEDTTE